MILSNGVDFLNSFTDGLFSRFHEIQIGDNYERLAAEGYHILM